MEGIEAILSPPALAGQVVRLGELSNLRLLLWTQGWRRRSVHADPSLR